MGAFPSARPLLAGAQGIPIAEFLSTEGLSITRRLVDAGRILGIRVLDHVIVGRGEREFFSLRESGMASFE